MAQLKLQKKQSPLLAKQEKGQRPSNALPYELYVHEEIDKKDKQITLHLEAGNTFFGKNALSCPYNVYTANEYKDGVKFWPFAVLAGESLDFSWNLSDFHNDTYALTAYGPNGFMRGFKGKDEALRVTSSYEWGKDRKPTGSLLITLKNEGKKTLHIEAKDNAYSRWNKNTTLAAGKSVTWKVETTQQSGWYDVSLRIVDGLFERHFAGRVETGKHSKTDPQLG